MFQYKTYLLEGFLDDRARQLEIYLNENAKEGWRLKESLSFMRGENIVKLLILELFISDEKE